MKGAAPLDDFLGKVLPQCKPPTQAGASMADDQLEGTVAAARGPKDVVDSGIREFILDSGASLHIGPQETGTRTWRDP